MLEGPWGPSLVVAIATIKAPIVKPELWLEAFLGHQG
jgi:hypothetical protein